MKKSGWMPKVSVAALALCLTAAGAGKAMGQFLPPPPPLPTMPTPTPTSVPSAADLLGGLKSALDGYDVHKGIKNSLSVKLNGASDSLSGGDRDTAVNKLDAFLNEVSAQSGKHLTADQAADLQVRGSSVIAAIQSGR